MRSPVHCPALGCAHRIAPASRSRAARVITVIIPNPTTAALIATLRRVALFNEITEAELGSIAERVTTASFDPGQVIFTAGDRGGDLLIVHRGSVRVTNASANGRQQLLSIEGEGSSLGEVSVFDGGPYSATAITPTVLLRVKGEHFRNLCAAQPAVAFKVIRVLGHRLRRLRGLVEQLSFETVRSRLIAHLLELAREQGTVIALGENNEEIAARLGTVRDLVSRNLGRLHNEGLIRMRKREVTIPSLSALRNELDQA